MTTATSTSQTFRCASGITSPVRRSVFAAIALSVGLILAVGSARAAIVPRLQNGENLKVCAIGTSLTATDWGFWFQPTGDWLNGLGYAGQVTLSNRAVVGSASNTNPGGGLLQLADVLALDNPDAIFIEFGINDAYLQYNITQQTSKDNLQSMITQINAWAASHSKEVDIIVQTMNNCVGSESDKRPLLADYYQGYRAVVLANPGVLLVDHYPNWLTLYNSQTDHATWNSYLPDTIHVNSNGAQNVILPTVKAALLAQAPITAPPTPGDLTAQPFDQRATLTWTASFAATGYNVRIKNTTTSGEVIQAVTASPCTITDLTNGTLYEFSVSASNSAGESAYSAAVSATPHLTTPLPPTNLAAMPGNVQVALTWTASLDATGYIVQRSTSSGSGYTEIGIPSGTSYTDSAVSNGTMYYYVVSATNSEGPSANSSEVSAMPNPSIAISIGDPSFEIGGAASALPGGVNHPLASPWSSPNDWGYQNGTFGGLSATDGSWVGFANGNGTAYQTLADTLQPNTTYTLSVDVGRRSDLDMPGYSISLYAGNTQLASASGGFNSFSPGWITAEATYSSPASVTAGQGLKIVLGGSGVQTGFDNVRLSASGLPAGPPAAPTGLVATAGNAQVALTWTASSGATGYSVKRSTSSGSGYAEIGTPSGASYTDSTAANGTTYYYVVSATNTAGESDNSSQVSATPSAPVTGQVTIPLTSGSYNQDAVYALSGDTFHGSIVADWSLYETGGGRPGSGMPTNGIISGRGGVSFQMASYTANNMLLLDNNSGTMTLGLSGQFTTLSFLSLASTSGNNPTANFTLHFSDNTTATGSFTGSDWAGNGSQVFSAGILNSNLTTYLTGSWGALYQADYALASGDQTKTLQSISFTSLGKVGVLAISGYGMLTPPVSDYTTWLGEYTFAEGADTTPTGDPDGDGLNNQQEYAFGLDPTSGSSVSPITQQLDKTSGTFKYTRRKTSGLTHIYQWSTTLSVPWNDFTPVTNPPAAADISTTVEEVTIEVPAAQLEHSKLFLRVKAE